MPKKEKLIGIPTFETPQQLENSIKAIKDFYKATGQESHVESDKRIDKKISMKPEAERRFGEFQERQERKKKARRNSRHW